MSLSSATSFTGSVQSAAHILSPFSEKESIKLTLLNGAGPGLKEGQEVTISATGTVVARTAGTQFPIGTVTVGKGSRNGNKVTVAVVFERDINGKAGASAITAGVFVKQDTTTLGANDEPVYVAAAAGDYVLGYTLSAAAAGGAIRVGVLRSPFKL